MDAHVLHIGADDCHRVAVLRSVGYRVDECLSLTQLAAALERVKGIDAVFLTESDGLSHQHAISLARQRSAPVILFQRSNDDRAAKQVDLVVEPLTSPSRWLREVGALVEWGRGVRSRSKEGQEASRLLEMPRLRQWSRTMHTNAESSVLLDFGGRRTMRT